MQNKILLKHPNMTQESLYIKDIIVQKGDLFIFYRKNKTIKYVINKVEISLGLAEQVYLAKNTETAEIIELEPRNEYMEFLYG